jgi:hypothetical protein
MIWITGVLSLGTELFITMAPAAILGAVTDPFLIANFL